MSSSLEGWVYLLTNPAMPGLVKVGFTTGDPKERARQLDSTGLPKKFVVAYALFVEHPARIEARVHKELAKLRISPKREFFRCSVDAARKVLMDTCQGHVKKEATRSGSLLSSILVLHSGDVISCPSCRRCVRPFTSTLTDRKAGITQCGWCGQKIRFRMVAPKSNLVPISYPVKAIKKTQEKHNTTTIVGNSIRDTTVTFHCPNCHHVSSLQSSHLMRCPKCGRTHCL